MIARRSLALALIIVVLAPFVRGEPMAAPQSGEAVPREAMALLLAGPEGFGARPFDLRVGSAPAGFPADLLPTSALIRVSAGVEGLSAVVAAVTRFSLAERLAFEERLEATGWINPLQPAGFSPREVRPSLSVCRGDRFATLSFLSRSEGGSWIRVSVTTEPGRSCLAQASAPATNVPLPSMSVPPGARSGRASMGGTADASYSAIRLETPQTVEAVGAHYVSQLAAAGWTVEGQTSDAAAMSVTRLRSPGPAGTAVTAVLVVTAVAGSDEVDVLLRLVQPQGMAGAGTRRR